MDEYSLIPQPEEISIREREDAMGAYLMMFASVGAGLPLPFINLVAAWIYYLVNKTKNRFVRFHILQSLYSQLPVTIINSFAVVIVVYRLISGMGFPLMLRSFLAVLIVVNLVYFAFSLLAAIRARQGRLYYFAFFGRLAFEKVFNAPDAEPDDITNRPPY